jgi:hypothetical protein
MVDTPRKTFPELQALTAPVVDSDVLAVYRSPGPAKRTTASVLKTYAQTGVQPLDADLTAIAALTSAADKMPYATGAGTWAMADLTAAGRALLDDANAAAQRTTLAAVGTADLAASTGAALVGLIQSDTGAVARTAQTKARDTLSFADFGAVGDNSTDDTTAIGLAITAAAARAATGGVQARVSGVPGKVYKITSALALATFVDIDLNGSKVVQYTADTPIFSAPGTDIQQWSLRNGTLSYNTAQTAVQTSGIGLRLANGANSYNFQVTNLDISNACKGIVTPTTAGTFSFLGTFTNVRTIDCADWGWDIRCSSVSGANTNLAFNNCWAVQGGTPKAASKGFNIKALSQGRFNSMAVDHCALEAFSFESCTGEWGCLSIESCDFVGPVNPVTFFDSPGTVQSLKYIDNTYTSTGGDIYMLRPGCNVTGYLQIDSFIESGGVFTGANTYEVTPTAGMRIVNNFASTSRSPVFADFGIRRKVIRWNGIDLMRIFGGGQVEVFTTTVPASEEWIVGDTATNTAPAAGGPPGWMCTTAGTPGTWKAMANLAP